MTITRYNPAPRWSDATLYNGIAHFVEVPSDTSADAAEQVRQLLAQADITLAAIGSDKSKLLSATIYVTDRSVVGVLNPLWEAWLPEASAPSRACVIVELVDPQMLVEIAFVAAV